MKPTKFRIVFINGNVETVYTFGVEAARILGQSNQIRKGNPYDVNYIIMHLDNGVERIIK